MSVAELRARPRTQSTRRPARPGDSRLRFETGSTPPRLSAGRALRARAEGPARRRAARPEPTARPAGAARPSRQRSCVRATRHEARGQRSSACFSFHDARCSGAERGVDRRLVRLERRRASGEQVEDRRRPRAATRRSTRTCRRPRPGRSGRRRRRRAARAPPRSASPGAAQRQAVAAQALELRRVEAVRRADAREVLADARPLALPARRRRRSRGRPSGTPSRSRPGCRRARSRRGARSARARRRRTATFPS